jgi:uncharacterized protein YbjT (DUF2867 family)
MRRVRGPAGRTAALILVSGATGSLGRLVVRELAAAGAAVRAMVRDAASATDLAAPGVEVVQGDLEDPDSLDAALRGVEKAFLAAPASMRQVKQEATFIDAVQRAGTGHVVKLSLISADPKSPGPIPQWHGMAEKRLESSGVRFTHLRPNFRMQTMLRFAAPIRQIDTFCLPLGGARVALVDMRDVASATASVLLGAGHEGRTYVLTGPDSLTFDEVAAQLSTALGRPIAYQPITPEEFKAVILRHWKTIEPYADATVSIWRGASSGTYAPVTPDLAALIGRPPRSFAEFARDHAEFFAAAKPAARARRRETV